jgi:Tfp pilus assembly protein PilE
MLRLHKNKKAQNTAEYTILIALVIGAVVAMQTYAQRALQGRLRDAAAELATQTSQIGNSLQYEPYYLNQSTRTDRAQTDLDTYERQYRGSVSAKSTASVDATAFDNRAMGAKTVVVPTGTGM